MQHSEVKRNGHNDDRGSTKQIQDVVNAEIVGGYLAAHYLLPSILSGDGARAKGLIIIGGTGAWLPRVCRARYGLHEQTRSSEADGADGE